jgi:hypothetical protein
MLSAGIETVRIKLDLEVHEGGWYRQSVWGGVRRPYGKAYTYAHAFATDGLSYARVYERSDSVVLDTEFNLTSLLYGRHAKSGSLTPQETMVGLDVAATEIQYLAPVLTPSNVDRLRLVRHDPSLTFQADSESEAALVLAQASSAMTAATARRNKARTIGAGSIETSTYNVNAHHWRKCYRKDIEARDNGAVVVPGAVRLESMIADRRHVTRWADREGLVMAASKEIQEIAELIATFETMTADALVMVTATLVAGGADPVEAAKLSGIAYMMQNGGRDMLHALGVPVHTTRRYSKRVEELLANATSEDIATVAGSVFQMDNVVYARDLAGQVSDV